MTGFVASVTEAFLAWLRTVPGHVTLLFTVEAAGVAASFAVVIATTALGLRTLPRDVTFLATGVAAHASAAPVIAAPVLAFFRAVAGKVALLATVVTVV